MKESYDDLLVRLEEAIEKKQLELDIIKNCRELSNYFSRIPDTRNAFMVAVRKHITDLLISTTDLPKSHIASILNVDHAAVLYAEKLEPLPYVKKIVQENIDQWMKDGVYPVSIPGKMEASYKGGVRHIITYKLKPI